MKSTTYAFVICKARKAICTGGSCGCCKWDVPTQGVEWVRVDDLDGILFVGVWMTALGNERCVEVFEE